MEDNKSENISFEEALRKLEDVVQKLEEGNTPLEDSLKLFQEGIKLSQRCREILAEAEYQVEYLLREEAETTADENKITDGE